MLPKQSEKLAVAFLVFIAFSYIVSSAYLGLYEELHKGADVYGHILGFTGQKDFSAHDLFNKYSAEQIVGLKTQGKGIWNHQIYEFITAKISVLIQSDPLVVARFVSLFFWLLTAYCGYRLARLFGSSIAGAIIVFLLATSPMFLYYSSVPHPDMMAVACSIIALTILYLRGISWLSVLYALPFLAIATFIKSPIPFVFILFYAATIGFNINIKEAFTRESIIKYAPLTTIPIVLLVVAFLAAQFRGILLDGEGLHDFTTTSKQFLWFGGSEKIRTLDIFWSRIWERLESAGPFNFGLVYLAVVLLANIVKREKNHLIITASALIAFLGGWLTFPHLYYHHTYYQLPGMVIIFLSFAVSFSHLTDKLLEKLPERMRQLSYAAILLALIPFSSYQVLAQKNPHLRSRVHFYSGIEYALRNQNVLLAVGDPAVYYNPALGGLTSTKFIDISYDDFESRCNIYLARYSAIFVRGNASSCISRNKHLADYYIQDGQQIFFLNKKNKTSFQSMLSIAQRNMPGLRSNFDVFIDQNQLVYIKKKCAAEDINTRFFLHIIPIKEEKRMDIHRFGFENMDFLFNRFGKVVGETCIAVRELPSYSIKEIRTGQFIPGKGRVWEGTLQPITHLKYAGNITVRKTKYQDNHPSHKVKGTTWYDISNIILDQNGVMISFDNVQKAKALELSLSLSVDNHYQLFLYKKGREQKRVAINAGPQNTKEIRMYRIARNRQIYLADRTVVLDDGKPVEFDAIKLVPIKGDRRYSLGHLIISE